MKILIANNLYGAEARGGAERVAQTEAAALVAAGDSVVVVSAAPSSSGTMNGVRTITYAPKNICQYVDLGSHGMAYRLLWHWFDIFNGSSAEAFEAIVEAEKPDVVHTHNLMGLGFMIPTMLRLRGARHVHTVHDVQLLDPSGLLPAGKAFRPAPHQMAYIAVMKRAMGSPETVFFPSQFHRDLHERFGFFPKSKRVVLRNPSVAAMPRIAHAEGTAVTFLFAGQLEPHKGVLDLLDAWEGATLGNARLEYAGTGSLWSEVVGRTSGTHGVRLLQQLDRAAMDVAYGRADWVVVPSHVIENAPAVLMEAMARGIPAIASASGGIPEIVKDGVNGFLFPPGDVSALRAALERAASAGMVREGFSVHAQETVAPWSLEAHMAQLRAAYR